jgi:hypothetical protein
MAKNKKGTTPLMQQYEAIKAKHPSALLLFRVGDFYETFGSDAEKTARILGIVLTQRNNGGDQTTVGLVFTSAEGATGAGNSVNLAGIIAKKESAGNVGGWSPGSLTFFVKDFGTRRDGMFIAQSGYVQSDYSFRSPIFYDSNDTGYYIDPASTSLLNTISIAGRIQNNGSVADDDGFGIYWENGGSTAYAIYREAGAWGHPFPDLRIAFHTGIKLGANASYQGIRFYSDYDMGTIVASINDGDQNLRGYYDIIAYASDMRLKENIEPITNAIDKVKKLNGFTYNWNSVGKDYGWIPPAERESGVFAQEVQEVLPEAVRTAPFDQDHDQEGNMFSKSGENFLTVKYEKLVPLLIEAIKEQQKQIDELKKLINK